MKALYTSWYRKSARNPMAVAISAYPPDTYVGKRCPILAPTITLVRAYRNGQIGEEEYTEQYLKLLDSRNLIPEKVVDMLDDGSVLLCYEDPSEGFCHRFILAHWIERGTGLAVPELVTAAPKKPTIEVRTDLFVY